MIVILLMPIVVVLVLHLLLMLHMLFMFFVFPALAVLPVWMRIVRIVARRRHVFRMNIDRFGNILGISINR